MDKFVKLRDSVDIDDLVRTVKDDRVFVLRRSRLTGTVKVRVVEHVSNRELKKAFAPYVVEKVYDELPVEELSGQSPYRHGFLSLFRRLFRHESS